jgi:hypothetical protein
MTQAKKTEKFKSRFEKLDEDSLQDSSCSN